MASVVLFSWGETPRRYPPRMAADEENGVAERLKAVADALEEIVADRSLLKELSLEERTRLLALAGDVHNPDVVQRRRFNKVVRREKKAARVGRDESVLAETGIRVHRAKPVFTTPNVYVPKEFEQLDVDEAEFREVVEAAALLRLQGALPGHPPLLRPALSGMRGLQLPQANKTTGAGGGKAVLLRGQGAVGVFRKVFVARGIEQVEDAIVVIERHDRGHDRNAALALDRHPVGARGAAIALGFDLAGEIDRTAEQQQLLGQRGLAGVRMRNDRKRAPPVDLRSERRHRNRIGRGQWLVHRVHVAVKSSKIKPRTRAAALATSYLVIDWLARPYKRRG